MQDSKRLAFFLPNIFTAMNMACGFAGIHFAVKGRFYEACMVILLGALFDMVDGRIARLTGTQSAFGEQFDSMSDLISFGMAPTTIFYFRFFADAGRMGTVFSFIYLLAGALRLARFNANIEKVDSNFFQGLPIPGAALGIIGFVLLSLEFEGLKAFTPLAFGYIMLYSILMVTNFPFPSFKRSEWVKKHKKATLLFVLIVITSLFVREEIMIGFWISLYVILSMSYFFTHRSQFQAVFEWKAEEDE